MPLQQFLFDIIVIQTETAMDCVLIMLIDFCRDSKQSNQREVIRVFVCYHVSETLRSH